MAPDGNRIEVGTVATGRPAGTGPRGRRHHPVRRVDAVDLPAPSLVRSVDCLQRRGAEPLRQASLLWGHGTASPAVPTPCPGPCPRTRIGCEHACGCVNESMQLAGTHAEDRRAGHVGAPHLVHSHRRRSVGRVGPAPQTRAPGVDDAGCSARRRPAEPAPDGRARRSATSPDTRRGRCADPPFCVRVRGRRPHWRHHHLATL